MTTSTFPASLHGKTLRWTFKDGPTKGMKFEHIFEKDGKVTWRSAGPDAKDHHDSASAAVKVSDDVHVVSYLSKESGYTLTVALNLKTGTATGFASNGKDWVQQSGSFEVLGAKG
ncbi:hypothetical protein SAMN05216350_10154 [Polaromonas sp. YR568]|uniref:MoaF N-terminal domain-containing protein n=1 Tax=Polaromonas sp. YR568 TaxID=1855301 RepID=UPI0008DFFAED|nr:MoaF N-terminal domain-containing protein [Polaromonas sp. YR568]SFU28084.1 hypothetical protein SAMN05216350_10154 [Polaromonas sp. YR568]